MQMAAAMALAKCSCSCASAAILQQRRLDVPTGPSLAWPEARSIPTADARSRAASDASAGGVSSSRSRTVQSSRGQRRFAGSVRCESGSSTVSTSIAPTEWMQKTVNLPSFKRGCHIITQHIRRAVPEINEFEVGIAHIFVMHTSASLTINENASSDVPLDMEDSLNRIVPEGYNYRHLDEGLDDMPAHVKASMMGSSLTIPIKAGRLNMGIWQGIWLNEHRNYGGSRSICITIHGQKRADGRTYK